MTYLRWLLLPFSLLYGFAVWIRNRLYDRNWLRATAFGKPTIVVGNLAVGGTGKSPMTEYLVRLLSKRYRMATLSRGYGRKTRGFLEVQPQHTADRCGDEPLQIKRKFPEVTVAVDENRVHGVGRLFADGHDLIVLDDAYQHRALKPGFSVLLFDHAALRQPKWLLPAGNYRDAFRERRRADIIVVTKVPDGVTAPEKERIRKALDTGRGTPVLFSGIEYGDPLPLMPAVADPGAVGNAASIMRGGIVLLLTGIANPAPLHRYVSAHADTVVSMSFPDHHRYTRADLQRVIVRFDSLSGANKLIVTTEKDAQRLLDPLLVASLAGMPVYFIPIRMRFDGNDGALFDRRILDYVTKGY